MKHNLSYYIENYFNKYLLKEIGVSNNTIISYSKTIIQLISYINSIGKNITFQDINSDLIEEFLLQLETEKNISISTRNQKLACIHSLFKYIQKRELSCFDLCNQILSIKTKKTPISIVSYMSIDEIKILLSTSNLKQMNEYRDFTILTLLYETGCRVQELIDLKLNNLRINEYSSIELIGKGNKARLVPISCGVKKIIGKYINDFEIINGDEYLFKNKYNNKFTRKGIQYIIDKYVELSRKNNPTLFKQKITPHIFRHSRAMHLLEAGVNLIYIRDILGHTSVITTEIYAKTNPKIKEKIIEDNSQALNIKSKYSDIQQDELLKYLHEISK